MDYITTTDVDTLLGPDWAGAFEPARAVLMANAWLGQRIRAEVAAPMPSAILQAGAEIAREAAAGKLYQAAGREVASTTVSAGGGVSVAKDFTPGSAALTAGESLATALIAPWTRRTGSIRLLRA